MMTGNGVNTVRIGGEVKHITELDDTTLSYEWSNLTTENADLYGYKRKVNQDWHGLILRMIGVHLPDKERVMLGGINARKNSV